MPGTQPSAPPPDPLADRLSRCYASAVHDVLRAQGHDNCVLPPEIRPLMPTQTLAGQVWTVSGHIDRTKTAHETLLEWTGVLSRAPPGRVVMCQPHNHEVALMGELSASALQLKGVRGYIVDGGCRDAAMVEQIGFPVWCSFFTPSDIVARWVPNSFGAPITIGSVTISSGDYVIADRDGVVVIPAGMVEAAVARTEEVMGTEGEVRRNIMAGMDPQEAYLKYGKFPDLATDPRLLVLAPGDNIAVARLEIPAGTELQVAGATVRLQRALGFGHKIALRNIAVGERIVKYGAPIGRATADIALGEYVHNHNVASDYMPNTVAVEAAP